MSDQPDLDAKTTAQQHADSAKRPFNPDGGEDEGSTSHDGKDDHLHEDQKPLSDRWISLMPKTLTKTIRRKRKSWQKPAVISILMLALIKCFIPRFDGAILSLEWKEAIWAKFVMDASRPRTPSEQQYGDR